MCRKLTIAIVAMMVTLWSGLTAQTLTVASGNTASDRYIPVYGYYMDVPQKSHILYPAGMLTDMVGTHITGLAYYFSTLPSGAWGGTQMVRMGITPSTNLQNGYDDAPVTTVWMGTLSSCITGSTMVITLDEPFPYSGGNLLIEFENPVGVTWKDSYFYGASQTAQLSYMTYTSYGGTVNPYGAAFLPQTTFSYESGCFPPIYTHASNTSVETVLLTWNADPFLPASSYTVAYKKAIDTVFTEVTVTDTFLTLSGLPISTDYEWKVRANCDTAGMSDWSALRTFATLQHPANLPYLCGFEDNTENLEWGFSHNSTNQWYIGEAVARSGEASLYISNDGGESNAYTLNQSSVAWAYRDIQLPAGQLYYQISFDFKGMGQNGQDYLRVFLGPQVTPSGSTAPAGATTLVNSLNMTNIWQHYSFTVDSTFAGNQRLYFLWVNNASDGANPPAAIDNIRVEASDCGIPTEMTTLAVTDSSAIVSWNAVSGAIAGYEVSYRLGSDTNFLTVTTMDTFCVLSGLQSSSDYLWMVRTRCSAVSQSAWSSETLFHTQISIAHVPYHCGFEEAVENNSWQFVNGTGENKWCIGTAAHTSGEMGMYISNDNGEHNKYSPPSAFSVWAYRDIYIDSTLTDVMLTFDYRNAHVPANSARVFMGPPSSLPSGNTVPENAVQLGSSLSTAYNEWKSAYYMLDSTQRGLQRLYFLFYRNPNSYHSENQPFAIDNIAIVEPQCLYPIERSVASLDSTTALLTWSIPMTGQPNNYSVAYKQKNETDFTTVTVTDTFVLLTGLEYSTHYVWKVRSNCSASEVGEWSPELSFLSAPIVFPLPYCCSFEDSLDNAQWQFIQTDSTTRWCIGQAVNNDGTSSLYVSSDEGTTTSSYHPDYYSVYTLAYRDLYFHPASEYLISFDVKESRCDYSDLKLIIGRPTIQTSINYDNGIPSVNTFIHFFNSQYYQAPDSVWQHYEFIMDSSYVGPQRIYFSWEDWGYSPCNPTAAVDNFCVSATNCGRPHSLQLVTVTDTIAELSWQPFDNQTPESYTVAYRKMEDSVFTEVTVTDTTCTIGGLQTLTEYVWKVRANCSGSESSFWTNEEYFYTEQLHVGLPYFCGFEDSVENSNWQLGYEWDLNQAHIGNAVAYSGNNSLYITDDGGITNSYTPHQGEPFAYRDIYLTPGFSKYQIDFDCKGGGDMQGFMRVFLSNTAVSGFLSDAPFWTHHSITVDSSFAGFQQLRIEFVFYTSLNPSGAIDNISIKGINHTIPEQLSTTDITSHSARLTWPSDTVEAPQAYLLAYRAEEEPTYTETLLSASDTDYQFSNLLESSWYVWKLKAQYANNQWSEWSSEKAFKTLATIPYFCDFEDTTENKNWTIRNGENCVINNYGGGSFNYDYPNRWFIGTPATATDNTLLYISSDNGVTNTYNIQQSSFVWAYRDIYFEPGYAQYQLSLDFKGMGQDGQDYVKLFLDTPAVPPVDNYNVTIPFTQIGEELNLSEQWTHKSFTVDSTHAGAQRLYILWYNNYNTGVNPPAAIDNISINVVTCGVPANLVSCPQDTTTTLSWSAGSAGIASSYLLAYKMLSDSVYTELTTSDTFLTIQGLIPNTDYIWHVRSICGTSDSSEWSSDALFTTTQPLTHLPYLCSFDNPIENSHWTLLNGTAANQWVIGHATGYGENSALYISNDNGTTNAYTITEASSVWAYRDVYFDEDHSAYQLSFDYKGKGQNTVDYMKVYVGTPSVPSGTATPEGAVQLGSQLSEVNDWTHYSYVLDSTYAGVQRIYFLWVNNNTSGIQPPAAVDNLSVLGLSCITPSDLAITDMTATEVTLSWSSSSLSQSTSYTVSVRPAGDTVTTEFTTTDTFYVVSGLTPSAIYYCKVRANCSASNHSGWSSDVCVRMPAALPYVCDFEDVQERNAWQTVNGNYINQWYIGNAVSNGGDYSLYISNDGGISYAFSVTYSTNHYSYVWAYRDVYFDPSDSVYSLSFDFRGAGGTSNQYSAYTNVYIGAPTIPNGSTIPTGLTTLETSLCNTPVWTTKTYTLDHSYAGLQRLYFFWRNTGWTASNPPAAIDNINIVGTPCPNVPSGLTAQVMDTLANLSWTLNGSADSYTVAYKLQYDTVFTYITVQDEHAILGNLTPLTTYAWKVRANCTATDHSFWSAETTFQTTENTARIPYICDFEDVTENSRWTFVNSNYTNKWYIGSAVNYGGNNSLYVSNDNGITNAYTLNYSMIWAYRDIYLDPNYPDCELSFDCRAFGENWNGTPYDYAKVFLGPPATPVVSSSLAVVVPEGATQMGDIIYLDSTWHNVNVSLGPNYSGLQRLYILWRSDASMGNNPPAAFDNISILPVGCGKPYQVTASSVADVTANLSWSNVYQAAAYKIAYREISDSVYTELTCNTSQHYLTGLTPMTTYIFKVKALCDGATEGIWSDEVTFTTTQVYATIPYYGSFEDADDNAHWTLQNGTSTNKWYIGAAVHTDGDSALYISNNGGVSNVYSDASGSQSWAYRDILLTPGYSHYHISFKVHSWFPYEGYPPGNYMRAFFGAPSEPSGDNQPAGTISLGGYYDKVYDWTEFNFDLDASYAGIQRIYFLWADHVGGYNMDCSRPAAIDELFIGGAECATPTDLSATEITSSEVTLSWSSEQGLLDSYGYYTIAYRKATDSIWTETTAQDTTFVLTGLTSSTDYVWRVKSVCSASYEGFWSNEAAFTTEAEVATLPYFCGFEDFNENREWRLLNADVNQWYIGQAAHQTGEYGLYISNDQGVTNAYTIQGAMGCSWAYRDIYFDPDYSEYQLSFDFRGLGQVDNDQTRVFVGPPTTVSANNSYTITLPAQAEELGNGFFSDTTWTSHAFTIDSTHAGLQRLYFLWNNNYYQGTNPPGAVDNIMIYGGTCAAPYALTVDSVSRNSISISFTPANADDQSWEAVIVEADQPIDTTQIVTLTSTSHTFYNLIEDTPYSIYVRTNCSDAYSSWCSANQRTECGLVTSLPYEEDFDTYGTGGDLDGYSAFPRCWNRLSTSYIIYPRPFIYSVGAYSAPGLLYFMPSNGYEVAITPEFDTSIPLNTLQVSFKFKAISTTDNSVLMVGVMTNPDDYATFTPVDTVYPNSFAPTSWVDKVVSLASYTGTGRYIAFAQEHYGNSLSPVGLDNVVVDHIPSCPSPSNVVATAVTYSSVSVDWQPSSTETAWRVVAVPSGTTPSTGTPVLTTSHPVMLSNLAENTLYDVFVQADCGNGDDSPWSVAAQVKTPCAPMNNLPYTENFDDYTWMNTSIVRPDCWTFPVTYADCPRIDWNNYGYYGMESKALLFHSDTSVSATAVTPSFDLDVHSLRMQFKLSADHEYIAGCMEVGVMSDPYDLSTFESVQVFSIAQYDTWQDVTVDFHNTAMSGTGKYIAFRQVGTHSLNMAMWIDDIMIYQASDCEAPTALTATTVSTSTATVTFIPRDFNLQWEYVVCDENSSPSSQTPTSISNTEFVLSNLIQGQTYRVYVRTVCGTGYYSEWSEPLTITTDCGTISQLPYTETFDTYGTDSESAFPDCWRRSLTSASYSYYPIVSSEVSASGVGSLLFFANSFSDDWAITPAFAPNLSFDSIQLDFSYYQSVDAVPGWDTMLVGVMDSPYDETSFVPVDTVTLQNWGVWEPHSVLFDNYNGDGRYVAFRYHCPAYLGQVFIDDVVFSKRPDVGVTEHNLDISLHIYPNPTTGKCTIRNDQYMMERIELYDVYGKQLGVFQVDDYQTDIDLSSRASGVYFVRVTTEQGMVTKRVVKR